MSDLRILSGKIRNGENFNFVKMGDGEMLAMLGAKGANCDGQQYSDKLGNALKDAYSFFGTLDNVSITRWKLGMEKEIAAFEKELGIKCTADHDLLLNRAGEITQDHYDFWREVKVKWKRKYFIGPARLKNVGAFLDIFKYVEIPSSNAFNYNFTLEAEKDAIYFFSAGMASKVWIAKLLKERKDITCIDCGSAFDPLFVGTTRTNQADTSYLKIFYGPLMKMGACELARKNFKYSIETHPERLYVINALGDVRGKVVYDLGCGKHKTIPEAIGVDTSGEADVQASIDEMPFIPDKSVDIIISRHSLEHVVDTIKTLKEWGRILKKDGKIIIILPDHEIIDTMQVALSANNHVHAFTKDSLRTILSYLGLYEIEKLESVIDYWSFGVILRKKI